MIIKLSTLAKKYNIENAKLIRMLKKIQLKNPTKQIISKINNKDKGDPWFVHMDELGDDFNIVLASFDYNPIISDLTKQVSQLESDRNNLQDRVDKLEHDMLILLKRIYNLS
jgi:hypothetical protein